MQQKVHTRAWKTVYFLYFDKIINVYSTQKPVTKQVYILFSCAISSVCSEIICEGR